LWHGANYLRRGVGRPQVANDVCGGDERLVRLRVVLNLDFSAGAVAAEGDCLVGRLGESKLLSGCLSHSSGIH
jgi:hypothetical protein